MRSSHSIPGPAGRFDQALVQQGLGESARPFDDDSNQRFANSAFVVHERFMVRFCTFHLTNSQSKLMQASFFLFLFRLFICSHIG